MALERYGYLPAWEGVELIGDSKKAEVRSTILGVSCGTTGLRLFTFKTKGLKCVGCGIEGRFFAIERQSGKKTTDRNPYHLNLYAISEDGREVLMTHDHIKARCLGGLDTIENTQTMCGPCNHSKGDLEGLLSLQLKQLNRFRQGDYTRHHSMSPVEYDKLLREFRKDPGSFPALELKVGRKHYPRGYAGKEIASTL